MEDKIIVYVAGNPDAYPLEYYDQATESYQGIIPQLLSQFSAQSRYEIVYYSPQSRDQRKHLLKNLQVDLLSGYSQEDHVPAGCEEIPLLETVYQGQSQSYFLYATRAAPEALTEELKSFLAAVPQEAVSGMLIESAAPPAPSMGLYAALGGLALCVVLLASAMALTIRHYRKKLRQTQQDLDSDTVTGLGNFDYLERYYQQLVSDKNRVLYSLIYFSVDTDRLRRLASTQECNDALRYCAVVLQEYTADTDVLAKVSENGFALLKLSGNPEELYNWAAMVLQRIRTYPQVCRKPIELHIAAGIYPLKAGDRDLQELVFNASQAARSACQSQEDVQVFSNETLKKIRLEQNLQATVEQALERQEFRLYIQFYVDAHTYKIMGGEALSRWLHPERGLLLPSVFVPVLEQEGLIHQLDYCCLRYACEFLQRLKQQGVQDFFLSCNFSRETFAAPDFAQACIEIIKDYDFHRELLILELTESICVNHLSQIRKNMLTLKNYGVRIALDDFGEGFTSFSDLQQYPVDGIKLDKGLVDNIGTRNGIAILRAMVQVGHDLGLTILAEGVEADEQVWALQQIHCDVIQGFRFHAPMPESECMEKILQQFRRHSM